MKKAFSLVELSIVLIIIGLLVAGVTSGSKLIEQSKIKTLNEEVTRIRTAFLTFQSAYDAYPGDFIQGFAYWGSDCGTDGDLNIDDDHCNGDGNYNISWKEGYRAWQHLQLADMIDGTYTGKQDGIAPAPGIDTYASKAGFDGYLPIVSNNTLNKHGGFNSANVTATNAGWASPIFTPQKQYLIDKKYDDGLAWKGTIRIRFTTSYDSELCDGSNTDTSAINVNVHTYDLTNTDIVCLPVFELDSTF